MARWHGVRGFVDDFASHATTTRRGRYVRFDERGGETDRLRGTAPLLDSTERHSRLPRSSNKFILASAIQKRPVTPVRGSKIMPDVHLRVKLPLNRDRSGTLAVEMNGKTIRTYEVLGRGSQGAGDTVFKNNGNTPTGTYDGLGFKNKNNHKSYGPVALRLKEKSGDALLAHDAFGRDGLLIHGGSLGGPTYWRGSGELRATHGCLRLDSDDMLNLQTLVTSAATNSATQTCDLTKITVSVETEEYDYQHGLCKMPQDATSTESQP